MTTSNMGYVRAVTVYYRLLVIDTGQDELYMLPTGNMVIMS